jgi:hypothetical protein
VYFAPWWCNLGKKERERDKDKEKEKAKRAKQIYFAGLPDLQSNSEVKIWTIAVEVVLATLVPRGRIVDDGHGWWEYGRRKIIITFRCYLCGIGCRISSFFLKSMLIGGMGHAYFSSGNAEERERMDFLLASLIGMVYLTFLGSSVGEDKDQEGVSFSMCLFLNCK